MMPCVPCRTGGIIPRLKSRNELQHPRNPEVVTRGGRIGQAQGNPDPSRGTIPEDFRVENFLATKLFRMVTLVTILGFELEETKHNH